MTLPRILVAFLALGTGAAVSQPGEYDVKAAFLLNFARYVEWPAEAFRRPGDPMVICVAGQDPFGRALDDVVAGKTIEGRHIVVRRIGDAPGSEGCHVLFQHAGDGKPHPAAAGTAKATGLLTIGESDGKAPGEAVITFVIEDGKVRFRINLSAAARENVRVSSRLLGLASSITK